MTSLSCHSYFTNPGLQRWSYFTNPGLQRWWESPGEENRAQRCQSSFHDSPAECQWWVAANMTIWWVWSVIIVISCG